MLTVLDSPCLGAPSNAKLLGIIGTVFGFLSALFWLIQSIMRCAISDKYAPLDEDDEQILLNSEA